MARQTIPLPATVYNRFLQSDGIIDHRRWRWLTHSASPVIDGRLVDTEDEVRLEICGITFVPAGYGLRLYLRGDNDFTSQMEQNGTITITLSTGESGTFAIGGMDVDEPYLWSPTNQADASALYAAMSTVSGTEAGTLIFDDGLVAPSWTDNTGDDITGTLGTAIADVTVPAVDAGVPDPTYASVGSLPAGVLFDPTTRVLSFEEDVIVAGTGTITIRATNSEDTADWTVGYEFELALLETEEQLGITDNAFISVFDSNLEIAEQFGIADEVLSHNPADSKLLLVGADTRIIYRWTGNSWSPLISSMPSGENTPTAIAVHPTTHEIYIAGTTTRKIYRWDGSAWQTVISSLPSGETFPLGLAILSNGDILMAGATNLGIFRWNGSSWSTEISSLPTGESFPGALTVDSNDSILMGGLTTDKVYRWNGSSWDEEIASLPGGEASIHGLSSHPDTNDLYIVGTDIRIVYRWNGSSWISVAAVPSAETLPYGLAIDTATSRSIPAIEEEEHLGLSDDVDVSVGITLPVTEHLGLSDTEADIAEYSVVGDEAAGLSDTEASIAEYHVGESEEAGLADAVASELTDSTRAVELSDFDTENKTVHVLGRITPGTFENDGTFYRSADNGGPLGDLGVGSDMEAASGQSVTRIAIVSASAGTIRFWDNPSGSHWFDFFNANPAAVLLMQFALDGPAYPFTIGGQGGNFSNWASADTDVQAALEEVRDDGKIFLFAIAEPTPLGVAEAAGLADTEDNAAEHRVVSSDVLGLADAVAGAAEYHIGENEAAGLSDTEAGIAEYHVSESEEAGLSDTEAGIAEYHVSESEEAGLADAVASELTDTTRAVELSDFDTENKTVHVLGRITPGTFENDGTFYRSADNEGPLGDLGAGSDMEVASGQSVTRIAILSASAGTIRFWDNPSGSHWFDFFNANPAAVLLMQFALDGPAYPFTIGGQGGNFSNWASADTDVQAALAKVRDEGKIFLFAIAEPTPLGVGEAVGLADTPVEQSSTHVVVSDEIGVLDSGQLGSGLVVTLAEAAGLSDTEASAVGYRVSENEAAGLSDVAVSSADLGVSESLGVSDYIQHSTPTQVSRYNLTRSLVGEAVRYALEVTHDALTNPLRIVADAVEHTIEGNTYLPVAFRAVPPQVATGETPEASIEMDNVGKPMMDLLAQSNGAEGAKMRLMQVVPDGTVSSIVWELPALAVGVVEVTAEVVIFTLVGRSGRRRPAIKMRHDTQVSPGLF